MIRYPFTRRCCSLLIFFSQALLGQDLSHQSYLAHIAAANGSLRLNEASEAKQWILGAPPEHRGWEWNYLNARVENSIGIISLDANAHKLRFNSDGRLLAAAMNDGTIRVMDADSRNEVHRLEGHEGTAYDARFSPDRLRLVSCGRDGVIRMWDLETREMTWEVKGGGEGLASVGYSPDGTIVGYCSWYRNDGVRGTVALFNAADGAELWRADYDVKPLVDFEFSNDGEYFAVGTWGWRVGVWETSSRTLVQEMSYDDVPSYSAIDDIAFSNDGSRTIAASKSALPRVWEISSGKLVHEMRQHSSPVFAVCYSDDDRRIYTAGGDATIMVWSGETGGLVTKLYGHEGRISSLATHGNRLVSGSDDGTIRFWDTQFGAAFSDLTGRSEFIYAFRLARDGSRIVASGPGDRSRSGMRLPVQCS